MFQIGKKYTHASWDGNAYFLVDNIVNDAVYVTYYGMSGYARQARYYTYEFGNFEGWVLVINFEEELEYL